MTVDLDLGSWPGTPCVSPLWMFTRDTSLFLARHATSALAQQLRRDHGPHEEPENSCEFHIRAAVQLRDAMERQVTTLGLEARDLDISWQLIGDATSTTRQGAQQRFSGIPAPDVVPSAADLDELWLGTEDPADRAARQAIRQLVFLAGTAGQLTMLIKGKEIDCSSLTFRQDLTLAHLRAAKALQPELKCTTDEIAAEARAHGMQWSRIAAAWGGDGKAAAKRFHKLSSDRLEELAIEREVAELCFSRESDDPKNYEEHFSSPAQNVQYAVFLLSQCVDHFEELANSLSDESLQRFGKTSIEAMHSLLNPATLAALKVAASETQKLQNRTDIDYLSCVRYFSFLTQLAVNLQVASHRLLKKAATENSVAEKQAIGLRLLSLLGDAYNAAGRALVIHKNPMMQELFKRLPE